MTQRKLSQQEQMDALNLTTEQWRRKYPNRDDALLDAPDLARPLAGRDDRLPWFLLGVLVGLMISATIIVWAFVFWG